MRRAAEPAVWAALGALLGSVITAGVFHQMRSSPPIESLPVLGEIPRFTLTERGGGAFGSRDLEGRPWVADFIFTRCSGICPVLSTAMSRLQARLAGGSRVRLVSISVDPAHDTPEVLKAYALGYGAAPDRWVFLTGERATIHALVRDGFKLAVAEAEPGTAVPPGELVTHSDRWVLVDGAGRIRAYYHGTEPDAVERVVSDLASLERE